MEWEMSFGAALALRSPGAAISPLAAVAVVSVVAPSFCPLRHLALIGATMVGYTANLVV